MCSFNLRAAKLHRQAINTVRDLIMSHDIDFDSGRRSRVALLYMPLLGIITDHYTRLCRDFSTPASASIQTPDKESGDGDTDSLYSEDGTATLTKRGSLFDFIPSLSRGKSADVVAAAFCHTILVVFVAKR